MILIICSIVQLNYSSNMEHQRAIIWGWEPKNASKMTGKMEGVSKTWTVSLF